MMVLIVNKHKIIHMKKLIFIAIAFVTLQVTSQDRNREMNHENKKEKMHERQDISAEDMAKLQTKRMTLDLDLTEAQQTEIKKINLENSKNRKAKREAREKNGKGEKPSQEEHLKMTNDRLDAQIATKRKMKKVLNTEQYKKWEKQTEKQRKKGHKRHSESHNGNKQMKKHK